MSSATALLADVLAAPEEDAPRLVYADWLLEQANDSSRARGEFIQLSCAIAKLPDVPTKERASLVRRSMELLATWELAWVDELLAPLDRRRVWDARAVDWSWSRGFIESYFKSTGLFTFFQDALESVQTRTPLIHVEVAVREAEAFREFLARPGLRHLKGLSIYFWDSFGPEALGLLSSHAALAGLESLHVAWNGHDELGELLSVPGAFPKLTSLSLERADMNAPPLSQRALQEIADSPLKKTVRSLSLERDLFGDELPQLASLPFDLTKLSVRSNDAGAVLEPLAASAAYPNLRELTINSRYSRGVSWSVDGVMSVLARRSGIDGLRLSGSNPKDLGRLLSAPEAARLRTLWLRFDGLGDAAAEALATASFGVGAEQQGDSEQSNHGAVE